MATLQNISEVLDELDRVIEHTIGEGDSLGLFAFIYRRTTERIAEGIQKGEFEDNARMERLDVLFAGYYIEAYWKFRRNERHSVCWRVSFEAARRPLTILQHVMLGMNAHINFDLAVAAATLAPGEAIHSLKNDFMKVNDILEELTDEMQQRIRRVSPMMTFLDTLAGRVDEAMIDMGIRKARGAAWRHAVAMAKLGPEALPDYLENLDIKTAGLGRVLEAPGSRVARLLLLLIHKSEPRDRLRVVRAMRA